VPKPGRSRATVAIPSPSSCARTPFQITPVSGTPCRRTAVTSAPSSRTHYCRGKAITRPSRPSDRRAVHDRTITNDRSHLRRRRAGEPCPARLSPVSLRRGARTSRRSRGGCGMTEPANSSRPVHPCPTDRQLCQSNS
jgi:hypothetical protein